MGEDGLGERLLGGGAARAMRLERETGRRGRGEGRERGRGRGLLARCVDGVGGVWSVHAPCLTSNTKQPVPLPPPDLCPAARQLPSDARPLSRPLRAPLAQAPPPTIPASHYPSLPLFQPPTITASTSIHAPPTACATLAPPHPRVCPESNHPVFPSTHAPTIKSSSLTSSSSFQCRCVGRLPACHCACSSRRSAPRH